MRSVFNAKAMAKALRASLQTRGLEMSHSECLEIVARQFGADSWNVLAAFIANQPTRAMRHPGFREVIPILRIFSIEKALEFYQGFLGFHLDWEHRYEVDMPLYMQVSRDGMTLHLSEHHGDASPGATVFIWMTDLTAFHTELTNHHYAYNRPGIEMAPWGPCMEVSDPFGNRIRFAEQGEERG
jgi:catechol 2,3-dioxygenase-like lactoylglutathione lyase family enzyme